MVGEVDGLAKRQFAQDQVAVTGNAPVIEGVEDIDGTELPIIGVQRKLEVAARVRIP